MWSRVMKVEPGRPKPAEAFPVNLDLDYEDFLFNDRDKRKRLPELKTSWDGK